MRGSTTFLGVLRPALRRSAGLNVAFPARHFTVSRALFQEPKKPSIKAIAELRKLMPGTSMLKAKEALLASRSPSTPDQDSIESALEWLEQDRKKSGAKKASKVAARNAREGVVAVSILTDGLPSATELKATLSSQAQSAGIGPTAQAQGAIVEVNCETDFVAKNQVFVDLVKDIVHTVALFPSLASESSSSTTQLIDVPVEELLAFPLLPSSPAAQPSNMAPRTVGSAIIDVVSRLGEKISIARASAIVGPGTPSADAPRRSSVGTAQGSSLLHLASAFAHGGSAGFAAPKDVTKPGYVLTSGRVASLLLTRCSSPALPDALSRPDEPVQDSLRALTRSLARQTAGMQTKSIKSAAASTTPTSSTPTEGSEAEMSNALYNQPFMMLLPAAAPTPDSNGHSVQQVLQDWAKAKGLDGTETIEVIDMKRWELGETAEPVEESGQGFAEEVRKAAGLA